MSRPSLVLIGLVLAAAVPLPAQARDLTLGFFEPDYLNVDPRERATLLDRTVEVRGTLVRLSPTWAEIAPAPPARDPSDPADASYRWQALDDAIRDAVARGLTPVVTFSDAPGWAEGPRRPPSANAGAWRPDPAAFGALARAAARRYSGSFVATAGAPALPRVRYWQAWNEPNLPRYLAPQWSRRRGRAVAVAPALYRRLLNAFAAGVKGVDPGNVVVTAGLAPYGDPVGERRTRPVSFARMLLCLRGRALRKRRCPDPARFDVLAHHPYGVGAPTRHALHRDDVAVPDLGKLRRVLRRAERLRNVAPAGRKRMWVTEISWDSRPPDPDGVPVATQARWLAQSLYVLWRAGVEAVTWFRIVDQAPEPSYPTTHQSGVFLRSGIPKPAARSFAFPFVGDRRSAARVKLWGKAPTAEPVTIERESRIGWRHVMTVRPFDTGIFVASLRSRGRLTLRARQGTEHSLSWDVR